MTKKTTFIAVLLVFFTPVLLALLLNSRWLDWRPGETRNHGELLEPPPRLAAFELRTAAGSTLTRADLAGQWQLLHYRSGVCGEDCLDALYWLRQVRTAQDRHQPEVGLMLVSESRLDQAALSAIEELAGDFRVIHAEAGRRLAQDLPDRGSGAISYIVDPDGHIILRYPSGADFNGMRRDLKRLLTWTQTGPE